MMEHRCIKAHQAGQKKSTDTFSNNVGDRVRLEYFQSKTSSLITNTCPECQLSLSIRKYQELVPSHYRSNSRISKQIASFDEQYLSHCLELIQISAAKVASFNFSVPWSPSKTNSSSESSFPSPLNASAFSSRQWILGSETRSKSMIVRSPLFKHGKTDNDNNSEVFSFPSVRGSLDSYPGTPPIGFSLCSSPMVELGNGEWKHGSDSVTHKDMPQYKSSIAASTSSDRSSCTWPAISQGILQCTMRNGITKFVFSMDNQQEVYVTRSSRPASSEGSSLDWTYYIHLSTSNRKDHNLRKNESNLVGRINASTSYKFSADGSKIMETEFILYGDHESQERELDKSTSRYDSGKHRKLPGKVSSFFKPPHLPKHRPNASTWGTSTSLDLSPLTPELSEDCVSDKIGRPDLLESNIPSNFELAAIVVKEEVEVLRQDTEVGGWGLSFLKRATEKQVTDSQLGRSSLERSIDVLVPAGYHGGPKNGNPGPSSLLERWRNGGQCDCGGWDTGCPLTLLNTGSDREWWNSESQSQGTYKSLNLFLKGDEGRAPSMKMVNIQNGIYCIDFQSRLSALQCFSIAVAVIHSRNPTFQSNTETS